MPEAEVETPWRIATFRSIPAYRPAVEPRVQAVLREDADPRHNAERTQQRLAKRVEQSPDRAYLRFSFGTTESLLGNIDAAFPACARAATIGFLHKML